MKLKTRFNKEKLHDHTNCACKGLYMVHFEKALEIYDEDTGKIVNGITNLEELIKAEYLKNKTNRGL